MRGLLLWLALSLQLPWPWPHSYTAVSWSSRWIIW